MLKAPIPQDEPQRLEDFRRLDMLLTRPEVAFDALTQQLARIFDVPGVMISFMDHDTQYYKAAVGLPSPYSETRTEPRELSVCSHVVGNNDMLVVEDLHADDRFCDNPVVQETGLRFYVGAPLRADSGRAVGSLCVVDTRPRKISQREAALLELLATGVMAQVKLQSASRKLLESTQQIDRDLQQAVHVQQFLLPPAHIEGHGWRIDHLYQPADRLGGDFIDVHRRGDGRLALLLADVCGHGTSAALTSAMAKTGFQRAANRAPTPAAILNAIQGELPDLVPPDRFISAIAALFDPHDNSVELASAGHPYPLLVTGSGVEEIRLHNHIVLLVDRAFEYEHYVSLTLKPGNRLLMYTDGATESSDENGAFLGSNGLGRLAGECARGAQDAFLQALFGRIRQHAGDRLQDDVALLTIAAK